MPVRVNRDWSRLSAELRKAFVAPKPPAPSVCSSAARPTLDEILQGRAMLPSPGQDGVDVVTGFGRQITEWSELSYRLILGNRYVSKIDAAKTPIPQQDFVRVDLNRGLVVLGDGVGGAFRGDVGSKIAVNAVFESLNRLLPRFPEGLPVVKTPEQICDWMKMAALQANRTLAMNNAYRLHGERTGTTLLSACFSR